jgi:ATP-binding cassette, subfamily B, bacterial
MIAVLRRLRPYAGRYKYPLIAGALLALFEVLISLAQPWPLALLVDKVLSVPVAADGAAAAPASALPVEPRIAVLLVIAAILAIAVTSAFVDYWSTRLLTSAGLRIAADARVDLFAHLQRLSLRFHAKQRVGDLSTRVTGDVDRMQDLVVQLLSVMLPNSLLMFGMAAVMITLDPAFALVALGVVPFMSWVVVSSTRRLKAAARLARKADGQVAAAATEGLGAVQLVQALSLEGPMSRRLRALTRTSLGSGLEAARLQARFSPAVDLASAISTIAVIGYGAMRVLRGDLDLAVLLVFLSYVTGLYKPLKALAKLSATQSRGLAAAERVLDVLSREPEVRDLPGAVRMPRSHGLIELHQVCYSYGREQVLTDVSLYVEPGETLALVGPTGAGKSTIAALLPRLMDPASGAVFLDGRDLRSLTLESLRSQIGLVLQDCLLLDGTLYDNIACGRHGATHSQVMRAARLAMVDEFAGRLSDGLDTFVGERGAALSGGQRQRVAIARALLRDAPILVLDEPTSALDAHTEEMVVAALQQLPADRTKLVIAHRLSTIRHADRVAVLKQGRVVEVGPPARLMAGEGHYAALAAAGAVRA